MQMFHIRRGAGKPLLLIHELGGSWQSWGPIIDSLAAERQVIALDLPGFGATPPLAGKVSIHTLANALTEFVVENQLTGVDAVGSSLGAQLVIELARRGGVLGAVIALDPGGFWLGWEPYGFYYPAWASIRVVRLLQPIMPYLTRSRLGRTLLFAQFSAHPWRLSPIVTLHQMRSYAAATSFDALLYDLAFGEQQQGAPLGALQQPLVIGWGRQDRVCFPSQAKQALKLFPDARLHWFEQCGHLPQWDVPQETIRLILASTSRN